MHSAEDAQPPWRPLAEGAYDGEALEAAIVGAVPAVLGDGWWGDSGLARRAAGDVRAALDGMTGLTLQERWDGFEREVWPEWVAGRGRPPEQRYTLGARLAVMGRLVRPGWRGLRSAHLLEWTRSLPEDDPLAVASGALQGALEKCWRATDLTMRQNAMRLAFRVMLRKGYDSLSRITEEDLNEAPAGVLAGSEALDEALCRLGVFDRSPKRANSRRAKKERRSPAEIVAKADTPERFRAVTAIYLEAYASRISDTYRTLTGKAYSISYFWRYVDGLHPTVGHPSEVLPEHARGFVGHAIERARRVRRGGGMGDLPGDDGDQHDRDTAHGWLVDVRTFFTDLCSWGTEPGSPLAPYVPRGVPLTRKDLVGVGFEKARRRQAARAQATVLDLEREMPRVRAYAAARWREAREKIAASSDEPPARRSHSATFWAWAMLELLVQSGLRIEEARELTTLDVLKRHMPDGSAYYMLHVKPSKYDRARVIPVGDGLGRVVAEIVRHVKLCYEVDAVPSCDNWDAGEQRALPRAPYLLQGSRLPAAFTTNSVRRWLKQASLGAGASRADGTPLIVKPHDCRRMFASEHLNNSTPVHVIQALLGHATVNTVMVYAKLYPTTLVEEYRKAVRGAYAAYHGEDSLRNPTAEEWAAFERSCSMRDMGTHLCALPTGEHCPKGLVCLGCAHAQPKKSAAPVFARMLTSHERELMRARERREPLGQLASREMEVGRIRHALRRAEELSEDVAAAIEASAEGAL